MGVNWFRAARKRRFIGGVLISLLALTPVQAAPEPDAQSVVASFNAIDQTLCVDNKTPAGIPYCSFFGGFWHDRKASDFDRRLEKLTAQQEANPRDATLLYLRLRMEYKKFGPERIENIKALTDIAQTTGDRPLATTIEFLQLSALILENLYNKTTITPEKTTELTEYLVKLIAQADEAAATFPDEGQQLYFRAFARLYGSNFANWLYYRGQGAASQTVGALSATYAEDAIQYLKIRYEADRNNPAKLIDYRDVLARGGGWEMIITPELQKQLLPLDEQLVLLKPDDTAARIQLLDNYEMTASYALPAYSTKKADAATVKAAIAKIEEHLARIDLAKTPEFNRIAERLVMLKLRLSAQEEPATAGDNALSTLQKINILKEAEAQLLSDCIARSAIYLTKSGDKTKADTLIARTFEAFERFSGASSLNMSNIFINSLELYAKESGISEVSQSFYRLKLEWFQKHPIGINLINYFQTQKVIAKAGMNRKTQVNMILTYISDDRLEAVKLNMSNENKGPILRQTTLIAADGLHALAEIFRDSGNESDAIPLLQREAELRGRFPP